jgi:hypothetical protein
MLPAAGQGSLPCTCANPMSASLICSMLRWVSATLRSSIWVERGIIAPARSSTMMMKATDSSTSVKPLLDLIAPGSGCNGHDPVVDGRRETPAMMLESDIVGHVVLQLKIVASISEGRVDRRARREYENQLSVVERGGQVAFREAEFPRQPVPPRDQPVETA